MKRDARSEGLRWLEAEETLRLADRALRLVEEKLQKG